MRGSLRRHAVRPMAVTTLFFLFGLLQLEATTVRYHVAIPDPASELFDVRAEITDLDVDTLRFSLPVWAPGAYDVVDFGKWVRNFSARTVDGEALAVESGGVGSWLVIDPPEALVLRYEVDDIEFLANSPWFGLSDIDTARSLAFANTSALFGFPEGVDDVEYFVSYRPPAGWDIAVALDELEGSEQAGTISATEPTYYYRAGSYDALVDAPVQMGLFDRYDFMVDGVPHTMTIVSPFPIGEETIGELIDETEKVIAIIADFFGEIPYDHYLFQIILADSRGNNGTYGALEHAASSTYMMPWVGSNRLVSMMLPIISHEYWHVWSPKRFHVRTLGPFNYREAPRTTSLWFHEGITDYYAHLLLARHGITTDAEFLADFGRRLDKIARYDRKESITSLSARLPWVEMPEIRRIYVDGPALAFLLDLEIRRQSGGEVSLDNAMRHFNELYSDHRGSKAFGDDDIIDIIETASGTDLQAFYRRYIDGTERPPIEELLAAAGLEAFLQAEFGAHLLSVDGAWQIMAIDPGYTADLSGVVAGDEIFDIRVDGTKPPDYNGLPFSPAQLDLILLDNSDVTLYVHRDNDTLTLPMRVRNKIREIRMREGSGEAEESVRRGWLESL